MGAPMRRLRPSPAWITFFVVLGATAFVFSQLEPRLLFRDNTPAGGDMGAHVWGPDYLKDHLLPHGRLSGWTPDWYLGFPYLVFYFPLPTLAIALLSYVLPYGIAFKLVAVSGLLTLPAAAWAFGKLSGMKNPVPACLAVAMVPFMFDRGYTIYGGNIPSTLAGEFAMSISLSICMVFLGVFAKGMQTGKHRGWAAALLALTALCHVVPAFFAIGGAVLLTLIHLDRRRVVYAFWTFAVSGLIAAFWVVPFMARIAYTNDMGWEKIKTYRATLFNDDMHVLIVLAMISAFLVLFLRRRSGLFLTLLTLGCAAAFVIAPQSRLWNARLLPLWSLSLFLLVGMGAGELGRVIGRLFTALLEPPPETEPVEPELHVEDIGYFNPESADTADTADAADTPDTAGPPPARRFPYPTDDEAHPLAIWLTPVVVLTLTLFYVSGPLKVLPEWLRSTSDISFIPDWVKWNFSGYEGKPSYPEYHNVVNTMAAVGEQHGCGRAMWEYEPELDRLGTPMALMLLPMWTDGCIGSMEGLFFESSATTPYHFLNQAELSYKPSSAQRELPYRTLTGTPEQRAETFDKGIDHLQLLGVRYYMAISPEVQEVARTHPDLEPLATSGPWQVTYSRSDLSGVFDRTWEIYRVRDAEIVASLTHTPAVMTDVEKGGKPWLDAAVKWYQNAEAWDVPLAVSGPKSWPRVDEAGRSDPPRNAVDPVAVSNIRMTDDRITFDVDKPGTPVLVKTSYFPNWQASGADGPWRVTPNLMVVVPTKTHVELHYGNTPVDYLAWSITGIGLVGLVVLARRRWSPFDDPDPLPAATELERRPVPANAFG